MAAKLNYTFAADALAVKAGVPATLLAALVSAESAWNPQAVSSTGATGLGQFTKGTAKDYGLMGDGFDNRADAALNLTAMVKYLADLKKRNPTWREVIKHYSGQTADLEGYARYPAGQMLVMVVDQLDGVTTTPLPGGGEDLVIVIDSITGHEQATGRPVRNFVLPMAAAGMMLVSVGPALPEQPLPQQVAIEAAAEPADKGNATPAPVFASSTFVLVPGPLGLFGTPLGGE